MSGVRIRTAWAQGPDGELWLASAYDEYTADAHGCEPPFYRDEVDKCGSDTVRELDIVVPWEAVESLFAVPSVEGATEAAS